MKQAEPDDQYSPEEAARRRDEVVKRMLNTPPKPHKASAPKRQAGEPKSRGPKQGQE